MQRILWSAWAAILAAVLASGCGDAVDEAGPTGAGAGPEAAGTADSPDTPAGTPTGAERDAASDREEDRQPDVIYVPTPHDVVDEMLRLADVTADDTVYDLGCGDGRIIVAAARDYGARAFGYDIDPERIAESKRNVADNGVGHLVTVEQADIFELDLSGATVIAIYLLPELNVRLIPQLNRMPPGSRIVSHAFDIEGVDPDETRTITSESRGTDHTVYLWTTPLEIEGDGDDQ